jgi:hypothetical protein
MDLYNPGRFHNSTSSSRRHKKYVFELFEEDIIKSPFGHLIWSCEMKIKVSTLHEVNQLMEFLENLKKNMLGAKKEEQ